MECKKSTFLIVLILSFISGWAFAARAGIPHRSPVTGDVDDPTVEEDWIPIFNLTDPHVVNIAQFAVDEHNRNDFDRLTLIAIASGEQLVLENMVYKMVIVARDFSKFTAFTQDFHLEVYEDKSNGQLTLLSFYATVKP